ncbi:GNAT family N-acetyltransferase [Tenacibaculum jejuense]|uniref:GCN5-related N-acetyltransferase n=1 Tax=Tenacibaculum jejuense TaxID=584609 RepID=A0A238UCB7_9FLAO|nr:GNAT family N-acetyltransferase [Tenacibaculum jejuense]SNR16819.1 GCN5-related N-acetyltransferase [Tenacibaculum jejuense]
MSVIYRKVKSEDNPFLAKVIRNTIEEFDAPRTGTVYSDESTDHLFELFDIPKAILWVAEQNGEAVGCCGIYPTDGLDEGVCELVKFYISNSVRGKGIGKELMLKSIDSARTLGYTNIYLESLPHFSKAIAMYEESGFKTLDVQLGNSGHSSCNVWMLKELKS